MAVTRTWKVYGKRGFVQPESRNKSHDHDWSTGGRTYIMEVLNCDKTGSNDYSVVRITCDTAAECKEYLRGHISDGLFENCGAGKVEEITTIDRCAVRDALISLCVRMQEAERYCREQTDAVERSCNSTYLADAWNTSSECGKLYGRYTAMNEIRYQLAEIMKELEIY